MSHIHTASGRRIFYTVDGSGPPLVLIPGQSGDRRGCIKWLAAALAPWYRVVSMDNRDAGESDPEIAYYTIRDMAGDVADLLDALDISRVHVVGHSMGGAIAVRFAIDHPARVDRLVMLSASGTWVPSHRPDEPLPPPQEWWSDDPVLRMHRVLPLLVGSHFRARMSEADVATIAELERPNRATWPGTMRQEASIDGYDPPDQLASIRVPTLVLRGDEDHPERGQALAAALPDARLLLLPGVGHLPSLERPTEVTHAIRDFLVGTGSADRASARD